MNDLKQLEAITQARYQKQQQSFQRLVAEETRLRGELARLNNHLKDARNHSENDLSLRAIGADIMWQGWVGRRKTELNMKLAQVLAIKEYHLTQVRTSYGKIIVIQELIEKSRAERQKKIAQDHLSHAIDRSLFR